jgi:hypothetical protein
VLLLPMPNTDVNVLLSRIPRVATEAASVLPTPSGELCPTPAALEYEYDVAAYALLPYPAGVEGGKEDPKPNPILDKIPPGPDSAGNPGKPAVSAAKPLLLLTLAPSWLLLLAAARPKPWPTAATVEAREPVLL